MITALYCDGGCVLKNPSEVGGTWGWVAVESVLPEFQLLGNVYEVTDEGKVEVGGVDAKAKYVTSDSGFVPNQKGIKLTNNIMEYIAVIKALEAMEEGWSGVVYSDSLITLGRIFGTWRNKNIPKGMIKRKDNALKRLGTVTCQHLDGHPTKAQMLSGIGKRGNPVSKWNVMADALCARQSLIAQGKIQHDQSKSILQYKD